MELYQTGTLSLTMQGFTSPPCRFSCPIALVAFPWNNCANTQRLGVAEKFDSQCEKNLREKTPSFPQKYGFENARKNLRQFSQIFGPGPLAGSLSQIFTQGDIFFSLTPVSVELAMRPACDCSLSTKCSLSKSSKTLQGVLVVPAGRAPFTKTTVKKRTNLIARVCTRRGTRSSSKIASRGSLRFPRNTGIYSILKWGSSGRKQIQKYTSNVYCNKPLICIAVRPVPLRREETEIVQYCSPLYYGTPPLGVAICLLARYHPSQEDYRLTYN